MQPQEGIAKTKDSSTPRLSHGEKALGSTQIMGTAKDSTRKGSRSTRRTKSLSLPSDDEGVNENGSEESEYEGKSAPSPRNATNKTLTQPKQSKPGRISKKQKVQRTGADGKIVNFVKGSKHELNFQKIAQGKKHLSRIKELEDELTVSEIQRIKLEDEILNMQKDALMHMKQKVSTAAPDNEVRAEFDRILKLCSKWAKTWSATPTQSINIAREELVRGKLGFISKWATKRIWDDLLAGIVTMRTVVEHLVSRFTCVNVFMRPFWVLGCPTAQKDQKQVRLNIEESLTWILKYAGKDMQAQLNIWRATTIRIIEGLSVPDSEDTIQTQLGVLKEERISAMVSTFLSKYALPEICKDVSGLESTQRCDDLAKIIRMATELSFTLAQQNVRVQACFRKDLTKEARKELNEPELLRSHASRRLDHDIEHIEDYDIDLVVHPAIIAWGDEQGENHDYHKLWQPAVVFSSKRQVRTGCGTEHENSNNEESQADPSEGSTRSTRAKKACLA